MRSKILVSLCILYFSISEAAILREVDEPVPDCASDIFCHGNILKAVQLSKIFDRSLDFVNMKLLDLPEDIRKEFDLLDPDDESFDEELKSFVKDNFEPHPPLKVDLDEWKLMSKFETYIHDEKYQDFYKKINEFWKSLAESTTPDAETNPIFHSMISLPNKYIKASKNSIDLPPSWQSYLIVRGLLSNQMFQTAAGIIRNYAALIESHEFALYSNREYWSQRSSLPFLALMAEEYIEENPEDKAFMEDLLDSLEKDFRWWYNNRRVEVTKNGKTHMMFIYQHFSSGPRPENYKEDYYLAEELPVEERNRFYSVLRDLDESIFSVSSRFLRHEKYSDDRFNLDVSNKIPVELNCLLLKTAEIIASWHKMLKINEQDMMFWNGIVKEVETAIHEVLYDEHEGAWFDWIRSKGENDHSYYITNLMPLYSIIKADGGTRAMGAINYMKKEKIITEELQPNYLIIPTSRQRKSNEWDYPHGSLLWNVFIIHGLRHSGYDKAHNLATDLGSLLIHTIHKEFDLNDNLLDHYRVNHEKAENPENTVTESSPAPEKSSAPEMSDGAEISDAPIIKGAPETSVAPEISGALKSTGSLKRPSSPESIKNIPEVSSSTRESDKISASALGATIDLLKTFGKTAKHTDYDNFKPIDEPYVTIRNVGSAGLPKKIKKK